MVVATCLQGRDWGREGLCLEGGEERVEPSQGLHVVAHPRGLAGLGKGALPWPVG